MLKEEYKGSYPNTVFYSFFKDEKKPTLSIINKMLERLKIRFNKAYNCIDFYDTTTNKLIHREI